MRLILTVHTHTYNPIHKFIDTLIHIYRMPFIYAVIRKCNHMQCKNTIQQQLSFRQSAKLFASTYVRAASVLVSSFGRSLSPPVAYSPHHSPVCALTFPILLSHLLSIACLSIYNDSSTSNDCNNNIVQLQISIFCGILFTKKPHKNHYWQICWQ